MQTIVLGNVNRCLLGKGSGHQISLKKAEKYKGKKVLSHRILCSVHFREGNFYRSRS